MRTFISSLFLFTTFLLHAQTDIGGVVTNANGEHIEFASVFLENTSYAAVSDESGRYLITGVPDGEYVLKVTFLGYQAFTQKLDVRGEQLLTVDVQMEGEVYALDKIEIIANRVDDGDVFTYTQVGSEVLEENDSGQDMPYLLRFTPSAVVTSDAGAGIGYTGIRIRGTDPTRINVTINGVPLNDAESQGVFWVDLPDFASSVDNIQVQRGVGTSTNGAGAFGGTISLNTQKTFVNPYASFKGGIGSFNTKRLTAKLGTGLINDRYAIDARYSLVKSDGYIDRASSDLNSLYFSAARVSDKNSLRLMVFTGHETTYQSWYGAPEARVDGNIEALTDHYYNNLGALYFNAQDSINLFDSDRRYNYYQYENQVDDYKQTHIQLHSHNTLKENLVANTSIHYTKGQGYFEEFKVGEDLSDYDIPDSGISDLVRRRWLDNDFYGINTNLNYLSENELEWSGGISWYKYIGGHFGRVIEVYNGVDFDPQNNYYFNEGNKLDRSAYSKISIPFSGNWTAFGDLQWRNIEYAVTGDDNDGLDLDVDASFHFLNPKAGLHYQWSPQTSLYFSYAIANKEPNRSDFIDYPVGNNPQPEKLYDLEIGWRKNAKKWGGELVFYHMNYSNQLVLTGALNDVGSPLRTNVEDSYRMGLEMSLGFAITERFEANLNATISKNKINEVEEVLYDYTDGFEEIITVYEDTDIAFSPNRIIGLNMSYDLGGGTSIDFNTKHVGDQYLDNFSNEGRKLDAYTVSDLRLNIQPSWMKIKKLRASLEVRNIFNTLYAANGYTYSYIYGGLITENYLYPQADRNFMLTVNVDL